MYVKASSRRIRDGSVVRYLQLAHNEWDATAGVSRTKVLYSFGREDQLDREAVRRLVAALSRLLDPADALAAAAGSGLTFTDSRPLGGTFALDGLWHKLGIDTAIRRLLTDRRFDERVERILFALVANRALEPSSKLAAAEWMSQDVWIRGLADLQVTDDACYRAMDWLLEIEPKLAEQVFWNTADLMNLEVDLLFFDTTSTYFETGDADEPVPRDERGQRVTDGTDGTDTATTFKETGFRTYGKSKGSRDDLPQVVVGMAVTREGIPVRCWSWPNAVAFGGFAQYIDRHGEITAVAAA